MPEIRLVAADLDGTLLDPEKRLSSVTFAALRRASGMGVEVVPATGRFFGAMPEEIKSLPFVRYVITVNGAKVLDLKTGEAVFRAEIPAREAVSIMEYLDTLPVVYDCFAADTAFMSRALYEKIPDFAPDKHYYKMLTELRQPVDDLKDFLLRQNMPIQKTQFFFRDMELRRELLKTLPARFPDYTVTSSVVNNIEITHKNANKGAALEKLCAHLGLRTEEAAAFGDDLNDVPMLLKAGVGVAMENAGPEAKAAADLVTLSNAQNGVAAALCRLLGVSQEEVETI